MQDIQIGDFLQQTNLCMCTEKQDRSLAITEGMISGHQLLLPKIDIMWSFLQMLINIKELKKRQTISDAYVVYVNRKKEAAQDSERWPEKKKSLLLEADSNRFRGA